MEQLENGIKGCRGYYYSKKKGLCYSELTFEEITKQQTAEIKKWMYDESEERIAEMVNQNIENSFRHEMNIDLADCMDGKEFCECVECKGFIDDDGRLGDIIVDGFTTNLGVECDWLSQGEFRVDLDTFKDICKKSTVLVNWCNR